MLSSLPRTTPLRGAESDDETNDLIRSVAHGLHVDPITSSVGITPTGTIVANVDLSVASDAARLNAQREVLAPTTLEHVFATSLLRALEEHGKTNVILIEQLLADFEGSVKQNPHLWQNQYAATNLMQLAVGRRKVVEDACDRVYKALHDNQATENGAAALAALAQHQLLMTLVVLPDRLRRPLDTIHESVGLRVLGSLKESATSQVAAVRTPRTILGACDDRWQLGTAGAAALSGLRQLLRVAEHAMGVIRAADGASSGRVAALTTLHGQLAAGLVAVRDLIADIDAAVSYVEGLRRRCRHASLPPPEEWLDAGGGGNKLALSTVVGFVETRHAAAKDADAQHNAAMAKARTDGYTAASSLEASAKQAVGAMERELAELRRQNAERGAEVLRLQQLLIAAQVPFDSTPSSRAAWQQQGGDAAAGGASGSGGGGAAGSSFFALR